MRELLEKFKSSVSCPMRISPFIQVTNIIFIKKALVKGKYRKSEYGIRG
jgi:hypothetical protein